MSKPTRKKVKEIIHPPVHTTGLITYPKPIVDAINNWLDAISPPPFVDRNIVFLPNTVKKLHDQQLQAVQTQDQKSHC